MKSEERKQTQDYKCDCLAGWFVIIFWDRSGGHLVVFAFTEVVCCTMFSADLRESCICLIQSVRQTLVKLITLWLRVKKKLLAISSWLEG